jgi:hypothetical protein
MAAQKSSFQKGKQQQSSSCASAVSGKYSSSKKRKYDGGGGSGGGGYKSKASYNTSKNNSHNNNSEQTPSNKKRALKAERQSHRKHAPIVRSAKTIWNELRIKTNDTVTNATLCTELHGLLKGKCMEVAMQHDASRCVQGVLQFGTEDMKREVVMELCRSSGDAATTTTTGGKKGHDDKSMMKKDESKMNLAELCKIQYAHFVVLKMIKYCARDEVCVKLIVKVRERGETQKMILLFQYCVLHGVNTRFVTHFLFSVLLTLQIYIFIPPKIHTHTKYILTHAHTEFKETNDQTCCTLCGISCH